MCKGPEVGTSLVCWRNREKVHQAGAKGTRRVDVSGSQRDGRELDRGGSPRPSQEFVFDSDCEGKIPEEQCDLTCVFRHSPWLLGREETEWGG